MFSPESLVKWYFTPKPFEKDGKVYEQLGIKPLEKLVVMIGTHFNSTPYFLKDFSISSLTHYEMNTRFFESTHLKGFGALVVAAVIVSPLTREGAAIAIAGAGMNLALVALQRYNRSRIYSIYDRKGLDH